MGVVDCRSTVPVADGSRNPEFVVAGMAANSAARELKVAELQTALQQQQATTQANEVWPCVFAFSGVFSPLLCQVFVAQLQAKAAEIALLQQQIEHANAQLTAAGTQADAKAGVCCLCTVTQLVS